jgi:hypothetical protein
MEALTPIHLSLTYRSPCFTYSIFQTIPSPNTWRSPVVAFPRYVLSLSSTGFPFAFQYLFVLLCTWVWASLLARKLAGNTRPKRVRLSTDWSFASCCSPPRFTATQLQSATGCSVHLKRTFTSLIECARRRTSPRFHRGKRVDTRVYPYRRGVPMCAPCILIMSFRTKREIQPGRTIPIAMLWSILTPPLQGKLDVISGCL